MDFGFIRVAAAIPSVKVADCTYNIAHIEPLIRQAAQQGAAVVALPELSITGYTCADLFNQPFLLQQAEIALGTLLQKTADLPTLCIVGMPVAFHNQLYNTAVVFCQGHILGVVPKSYLPNYNEFYEARWFASGAELSDKQQITLCGQQTPFTSRLLFHDGEVCLGIEICEDLWVPIPPSSRLALAGANLLVNISASDEMVGKHSYLCSLIEQQSARTISAYLYCSAGCGESSTDLVFAGNGLIVENGTILQTNDRFSFDEQITICDVDIEKMMAQRRQTSTFHNAEPTPEYCHVEVKIPRLDYTSTPLMRKFEPYPFVPREDAHINERCEEIFNIQVCGLAQRIRHTHCRSAVIGISGGLDSTLALLVSARTFDKLGLPRTLITGVTMPGFGTTGRTYNNAVQLMKALGVTIREISIRAACEQHFADIGLDPASRDVTYENAQARERTQILMDIANQTGGLVIGTGDLSELALGWATYNGDHMSMYGVNCGIPKTLVRHLVRWVALGDHDEQARPWLLDILDTPISPELLPADANGQIAQRTEELVGPYELHDFFLYYFVRFGFRPAKLFMMASTAFQGQYDHATIKKWLITFLKRFFAQQFKRSALPDGPKVGSVTLSPRGDWRMPSDASCAMWITEAESL